MTVGILQKIRKIKLNRLYEEWVWISRYMRRYAMQIVFYILLGISGTLLGLAGSLISKQVIDAVTGYNSASILPIAALYAGMGILTIAINAVTSQISTRVQTKVHQEIRADVFNHILMADWESIADYHSGDLLNRATDDAGTVASAVLGFVPDLITSAVMFAGALAIIIYYDPVMALIALGSSPVMALCSRFLMRKIRAFQMESRKISSEITSFNEESFQNVQFIKSLELANLFSFKMRALQQKSYDFIMRHNLFSIGASSVMSLIGRLISYACYGWSVYRLWSGDITYGTMMLFLQLAGSLMGSFNALVGIVPKMLSAGTSARRVMDIVQLPREDRQYDRQADTLKRQPAAGMEILLDHVHFSYMNKHTVMTDVTMHIAPGEMIGVVGPSGQGKTTLLRILLGLVNVSQGTASIYPAGDTASAIPIGPSTRKLFTYVPQDNMLFSGTVAENLRIVKPEAADEELISALRDACMDEEILSLPDGLNSRIGERGHGFSEGQAQRISLARALLCDAPVLLLDEVTSALDTATERRVLDHLKKHGSHKTIIFTTHRLSVLDMCTHVFEITDRHLSQISKHDYHEYLLRTKIS